MADTSTASQTEQNTINASTEVNFDSSLTDRLSNLNLGGNETLPISDEKPKVSFPPTTELSSSVEASNEQSSPEKPSKSVELNQSIQAGEVSDNSECSLEVEETSNESESKSDANVSDEEMYIEQDHDEDVEEEEEFHEVQEEDKHKTSQESVGGDKLTPTSKSISKSPSLEPSSPINTSSDPLVSKKENVEVVSVSSKDSEDMASAVSTKATESSEATEKSELTTTAETKETDLVPEDKAPSEIKNNDWANIMSNVQDDETIAEDNPDAVSSEESKGKTEDCEKKELDLDEDVKNPQYIPKKGIFYEHDDRSHDTDSKKQTPASNSNKNDEELTNEVKRSHERSNENRRGNRKQRTDADRWNHDLFKDEKQKPKNKNELSNSYGYDNRNRTRGSDNKQDRVRQPRESRAPRQGQAPSQTQERRPRRQNNRHRADTSSSVSKRDVQNSNKPVKTDSRPEPNDVKQAFQTPHNQVSAQAPRREHHDRVNRVDSRGRRQNSTDRPANNAVDNKLPPINTVMPPITTWSNKIEDMVKEENSRRKESPSRQLQQNLPNTSNGYKGRPNEYWSQNNRYQPQQAHKGAQYLNRNHYGDRANQHPSDWRRSNNTHYSLPYNKPSEYEPIKTQTFENSRLSHSGMRSQPRDVRDVREIIDRRLQNQQQNFQDQQQSFQNKPQHQHQHLQHFRQQPLQQQPTQQHLQPQQPQQHQQQQLHQQQLQQQQHQAHPQQHQQATPQPAQNHIQTQKSPQQATQNARQASQAQQLTAHVRPNANIAESTPEPERLTAVSTTSSDLINSRPIIKTDTYTGTTVASHSHPHSQTHLQHSHNHRSMGGPMSQPGMVPSHMNAGGSQAQYYTASVNSRDPAAAAAALATAYHGYIPGGHSVIDSARYHMTDHGYMPSQGQANDLASAPVLHQQGIYTDATSAGGTVASSAYMAQAGSTLSPSNNIPVTGAGPPQMAPVSYLQHSQYAPPPYSNPYSQPQHNQAPPQSSHGYSPYWTYI